MKKLSVFTLFLLIFCLPSAIGQTNMASYRACYQSGSANYDHTAHLVTDGHESTFWQGRQVDNEWIYTDLGYDATISSLTIIWGDVYASEFRIELSSDQNISTKKWTTVYHTSNGKGGIDKVKIKQGKARYVRLVCVSRSAVGGCVVKEMGVFGGTHLPVPTQTQPRLLPDLRQFLSGGNWKLQRQSFVEGNGSEISRYGFPDANWIPATVPGTILSSFLNIGALPDPNFGDQQLMISDDFFTANFWYRNTFEIPEAYQSKQIWLNFKGINWKADVFFNGNKIGRIEGAYTRANFNITQWVEHGKKNCLAVLIYKNDHPGEVSEQHLNDPDDNGGIIGLDSPSILASIGWNWIPTIRGRNCGIWNDVFLSCTQNVSIVDPFVKTELALPDTSSAKLKIETSLKNSSNVAVDGSIVAAVGNLKISKKVHLEANETKNIKLEPSEFSELNIQHPALWWPNGYGKQNLYQLQLQFMENGTISDQKQITFGIREYSYTIDKNNLKISVNGFPLIVRGGNWGMPEANLQCDSAGYDLRVRLHKEMNLNIIRNWIGMVGHDAFYDACDRYGIMIWDDFWLANPVDGPIPSDNLLFMDNVRDKIKQRRNHASLALWCGRNEGYPPAVLDSAMKVNVSELDDTRFYLSSSAHKPVTGLGPYETKDPIWYFTQRGSTLHSEQGIVCVPSVESMKQMMPADSLWPISNMWGKHDWTQPRVRIYTDDLVRSYGAPTGINDFCRKSQMMNMEGPKAMMESWQSTRGGGVIVWMTHPAWPSLICQTYDYYFEPTAAYFAFKTASEPIHILWRADNNKVQLINNSIHRLEGLKSTVKLFDFNGKLRFEKQFTNQVDPNSVSDLIDLQAPSDITKIYFIVLELSDAKANVLSRNFYWNSAKYQDYQDLNKMAISNINAHVRVKKAEKKSNIEIELENDSQQIALMARLKLVQSQSKKRVLPAIYSDNYISMFPGEKRKINIEFETKDLEGDSPSIIIEGWNVLEHEIKVNHN